MGDAVTVPCLRITLWIFSIFWRIIPLPGDWGSRSGKASHFHLNLLSGRYQSLSVFGFWPVPGRTGQSTEVEESLDGLSQHSPCCVLQMAWPSKSCFCPACPLPLVLYTDVFLPLGAKEKAHGPGVSRDGGQRGGVVLTEGLSSTNVLGFPILCCWISFPGQPQQCKWHQAHLFALFSNKIPRARSPFPYLCSGSKGHYLLRSPSLFQGCVAQPCAQCRPGWCSVLHRHCQEGERIHWLSQNISIKVCLLRVQNCKQPELFSWLLYVLLY